MKQLLLLSLLTCLFACSNEIKVTVSQEVINSSYIGNGAEWDPYDEVKSWGGSISEEDWAKLFGRLDFMRPSYVRCMINSPFTYFDNGSYNKNRNTEYLIRLLDYCQRKGIYVIYGEYNPPTWEMKDSQAWVEMSVDFLAHLVLEKGFTCIKHFVIFNEPDGNWASTNGDYDLWLSMLRRFYAKMSEYPGLTDKVSFAGPDVVMNYQNGKYNTAEWLAQSAKDADSLIGIYDVHSYPGSAQVRDGSYASQLRSMVQAKPKDKKIVLGEAGYKYSADPRDVRLWAEYQKRVKGHPFTKGSDCNMLVYDYFYGLDMPLLAIEAMNTGFSGLAVWMLDDAMHSNWDSGKTEDVKIWGMWNTVGTEVFNNPSEEEVRPWYYTWSLMCRYFPNGCDILKVSESKVKGVRYVAATKEDKLSFAAVNVTDTSYTINLCLPKDFSGVLYLYQENNLTVDGESPFPIDEIKGSKLNIELPAQSFILITEAY